VCHAAASLRTRYLSTLFVFSAVAALAAAGI
jgi:hypothetical protein